MIGDRIPTHKTRRVDRIAAKWAKGLKRQNSLSMRHPRGEGADQESDHRKSAPCPWDDHVFRPNPLGLWTVGGLSREREGGGRYENIPLR